MTWMSEMHSRVSGLVGTCIAYGKYLHLLYIKPKIIHLVSSLCICCEGYQEIIDPKFPRECMFSHVDASVPLTTGYAPSPTIWEYRRTSGKAYQQ